MSRVQPAEVDAQLVAVEQGVHGAGHVERNADGARQQVASAPWEYADRVGRAGESAGDLHCSAVAAEDEDGIVTGDAVERDLTGVALPLCEHDAALDVPLLERGTR